MSDDPKSRAYTAQEVRQLLFGSMRAAARTWSRVRPDPTTKTNMTEYQRMEGLCFSILNMFDGTSMGLPPLMIIIESSADAKTDAIEEGTNWFEDGMCINDGLMLHDAFYAKVRDGRKR